MMIFFTPTSTMFERNSHHIHVFLLIVANVEVVRARKRLEQADHVLDLIGALLAIVESLEPDE